jgi:toxin YoeB
MSDTDIDRNGNQGIGKPEPLSENLSGWWSRRIVTSAETLHTLKDLQNEIAEQHR